MTSSLKAMDYNFGRMGRIKITIVKRFIVQSVDHFWNALRIPEHSLSIINVLIIRFQLG
jgi:hypothetical protein